MTPTGQRRSLVSRISFLRSFSVTHVLSLLSTTMRGSSAAPLGSLNAKRKSPFLESFSLTTIPAHVRASSAKSNLLPLADAGDLRHLRFQLLVSFAKLRDLTQTVFDSANEVISVGLGRAQFVLVAFPDFCSSLCQFGVEARPYLLVFMIVSVLEQPESFFSAELCYTSEVLDSEAIQNLGSLQVSRPQT